MRTLVGLLVAVAVLGAAGCAGDDDESTSRPAEVDETTSAAPPQRPDGPVFPGTDQPLRSYRGLASYPWRVNIVENQRELLTQMQAVASHLDQGDFADVVSTCDAIDRGTSGQDLTDQSVVRFSGAPDETVTDEQANTLIDLSRRLACPGL